MWRQDEEGRMKIIAFRQTEIVPQKVMNARTEKTGYTVKDLLLHQ